MSCRDHHPQHHHVYYPPCPCHGAQHHNVLSSQEGEGGIMEGEANNGEKKADGWVEDPDSDIMDAKVMVMLIMMVILD